MNIATALNKRYLLYTGVMLYSLCLNNREPITAYLLNSDLQDKDIDRLNEAVKQFDITIVSLTAPADRLSSRLPHTKQWSIEAYYRLFLSELLPESVDRILYLDVDMIINKSLNELYNVDFEGEELIVCQDMCGIDSSEILNAKQKEMFEPILAKGHKYFNSGFLLMNMETLRANYDFEYYMKVAEQWDFEMRAPDQDILNYAHWQRVGYVDWAVFDLFARTAHEYGITYKEVKEQAAVVHYAGGKPWETTDYHYDIEKLWWDYAKETPFYVELLEHFMKNSIEDTVVEMRLNKAKEQCNRLIELNRKLLQ